MSHEGMTPTETLVRAYWTLKDSEEDLRADGHAGHADALKRARREIALVVSPSGRFEEPGA